MTEEKVTEMRLEKRQFVGKRNAYKETAQFVDQLLAWKDKLSAVSEDSGMRVSYLSKEMLGILGFFDDEYESDEEETVEE